MAVATRTGTGAEGVAGWLSAGEAKESESDLLRWKDVWVVKIQDLKVLR